MKPMEQQWIKVSERLPERVEPAMWYNDENVREVMFENDHATVLGFKEGIGVYKAVYDRYGNWSEVSTNSINGTIKPTHWMPLPEPPKE